MIEFFDSHCHLTDAAFRDDREAVLRRAQEAGVAGLVTIASTLDDTGEAVALARAYEGVWCSAGVHPHEAARAPSDLAARLRELASLPEVVALGETGLDYHYDHAPRPVQRRLFDLHLELAADTGLPVVVHSREADGDIAAALRGAPPATRGVLHCFSGGVLAFEEAMARNWYVSFSGMASFRTFPARDALRSVPPDRLLVETDAPYLAPVPRRGQRNEPAFLREVVEAVAALRGETVHAVAARTAANARSFYGLAG